MVDGRNPNSYGNRMGFDVVYQRAKNFTGWLQVGKLIDKRIGRFFFQILS